jgi:ferric-dicitrate binding protein FerR (iron transport regulator)
MTPGQAKEILALYRPGTADASDPDFAEALRLCEQDPELKRWFEAHCELHDAIRSKLRQTRPPEGFREQILSERAVHERTPRSRQVLVAALALLVITLIAVALLTSRRDAGDIADYRNRMTSTALRAYSMDIETSDLDRIHRSRGHLARASG